MRSLLVVAGFGLSTLSFGVRADPADSKGRADFSGSWALNERLSEDPIDKLRGEGTPAGAGSEARGGGRRGGSGGEASGLLALPWELLEDYRRLVIEDDGTKVRVTRPQGQRRVIFLDGEERELDDSDGPAKVTARRKGIRGEKIVVSVKWSTGRTRDETWEILSDPRRIAVTTKVKDRRSISFKRVYDPAPPETPVPPTPTLAAVTAAATATPPAAAPAAGMSQCSLRPPRGTAPEELSRMAKISRNEAEGRAAAFVSPRKPNSVISSDVEVQDGCLVWSFILRFSDKPGGLEVVIDAGDGKVLSSE